MRKPPAIAAVLAVASTLLLVFACSKDEQEAAKFERADHETFTREMSDMSSFQLANGITVYLQEEHTANQVALEAVYSTGFMDEPKGLPQLAHVTEHLAVYCAYGGFKIDEASKLLTQDRGMVNAEALGDMVHFDYIVKGERLEDALRVEAARLTGMECDATVLAREQAKVIGEIDKTLASPKGALTKFAMMGLAQLMNYGETRVEIRGAANRVTLADVRDFHKRYFRPDDMVLVLIGAFKKADAEALVRKYFEPIARRPAPPAVAGRLTRDASATWDVAASALYYVAPGPHGNYRERLMLTMFGSYLNQYLSASPDLYGGNQILYCTNQAYRVGKLPFFIYAQPTSGRTPQELSPLVRTHLERAIEMLADTARVTTIKGGAASFMTSSILKRDTPDYPLSHHQVIGQEALNVGIKHLLREGRTVDEFVAEVNSITPQEFAATVKRQLAADRVHTVIFTSR